MKGSLIIYKKIFKMEDADKQIIRQLLIKEGSYLVKGIKNGHHISIENIELNQDTVSKYKKYK